MSERKIAIWEREGLIDAVTASRLRAWESEHARPVALWAVVGIGVLAIGLGIVSVVAANWEDIPAQVRLGIHFALMAALAAALLWRGDRLAATRPWVQEGMLFVLGMLGLSFFGHVGQVYQTTSPLWQPLAMWLVLFAPLVLLRGQSWLTAALLFTIAAAACLDWATMSDPDWLMDGSRHQRPGFPLGLVAALPLVFAPLGAALRARSGRGTFWRRLEQAARVYAVVGASVIATIAGYSDFTGFDETFMQPGGLVALTLVGLACALGVFVLRRDASGRAGALVLGAAALVPLLALALNDAEFFGGMLFFALWTAVAAAALMAGWRRAFQIAVAVIAVRLIVFSFELASDLLFSGGGLIFAGLMILAIAWGAVRVSKTFAPPREAAA